MERKVEEVFGKTIEGESPVFEAKNLSSILSRTRHVKLSESGGTTSRQNTLTDR